MAEKQQNPIAGIMWMVVTGLCFVGVTAMVKFMDGRVPAAEAAFLRYLFGLFFLIPMWPELKKLRLSGHDLKLAGFRGVVHTLGVILWFYAMSRIPMAEVTAMNYLTPVYVTVLAVFVLGERLAIRRILAIGFAMFGAMLILRPGFRELDSGHFAMLATALLFSGSYLTAKIQTNTLSATVVVALLSVTVAIGLTPFALAVWVTPGLFDLGLLFGIACFATAGHFSMTLAFKAAPVTVTQPVTFLQLIWSVLMGALIFGEAVDFWVIVGGVIVLASATFMAWREAILKRRVTPPTNVAKF